MVMEKKSKTDSAKSMISVETTTKVATMSSQKDGDDCDRERSASTIERSMRTVTVFDYFKKKDTKCSVLVVF